MQPHPNWRPDHAAAARAFFAQPTGRMIIEMLQMNKPELGGKGVKTFEEQALQSRDVRGYEMCQRVITDILGMDLFSQSDVLGWVDTNAMSSKPIGEAAQNAR